jgi:hypothetical protein
MSVLVDSSVIVAFLHRRDRRHAEAGLLLRPVLDGSLGAAVISDFLVDEVLTFLVSRGATRSQLDHAIAFLLGDGDEPGAFALHGIGPDHFAEALRLIRRYRERALSFTDCTCIALMASAGITSIASFDHGFDGIVARRPAA